MRRRNFIAVLGAVSVQPSVVRAQTVMPRITSPLSNAPLVGFLNSASPAAYRFNADAFREGLAEAGFVEGRNVRIEERWANSDYDALPALAKELVAKGVVAIAATGDVASALAAQGASTTVPIVFTIGGDPVRFKLVESFNRPGGNLTGIAFVPNQLGAKRVQLLHAAHRLDRYRQDTDVLDAGNHSRRAFRHRRSDVASTQPLCQRGDRGDPAALGREGRGRHRQGGAWH